jgi:hypothetical protein
MTLVAWIRTCQGPGNEAPRLHPAGAPFASLLRNQLVVGRGRPRKAAPGVVFMLNIAARKD